MCHVFKHPKRAKKTLLCSYESQNNKQTTTKKVYSIHTKQITAWESTEKRRKHWIWEKLTISNISIYSAHLPSTLRQSTTLTFHRNKMMEINPTTENVFTKKLFCFGSKTKLPKKKLMHIWILRIWREPTKPHNRLDVSKLHTENPIRFTLSVKTLTQSVYSFLSVCCFMLVEYNFFGTYTVTSSSRAN